MGDMKCGSSMKHVRAPGEPEHPPGHGPMSEPMVMMATDHYGPYRWVQGVTALLAVWLLVSPTTLGYRTTGLWWSDIVTGVVVLVLSGLALGPRRGLVSWFHALPGVWLMFAPLAFRTPDPAAYANDTLVGALLVLFGFVIPMGMSMPGAAVPPGWTYNPASWTQRIPIIALGFFGFLASRYMAAFQLGHIPEVWDPFFGEGTRRVLLSDVSRSFPVSDAGLGAMMYLVEVLSTCMGDRTRWRTMPWMVGLFGVAVVPLGVVSIVLVVMQPMMVGWWCALCLATAAFMLLMIPLSLDEVIAMVQYVARRRREGASVWRTFWLGGNMEAYPEERRAIDEPWTARGMLGGLTGSPWLYAVTVLGAWLMFAPAVIGFEGALADSHHLVGALVIVFAVIALAEVGRPARLLNVMSGAWLVASPWFMEGSGLARWNGAAAGLLIVAFSLPLGRVHGRYGTFDRWIGWGTPRFVLRAKAVA